MSTEGERAGAGDLPQVNAAKDLAKLYAMETGLVAICLLKGFLIAAGFWLLVYGFHAVTEKWKLEGFAPELLKLIHDYGVAIAFVLIVGLFVADFVEIRRVLRPPRR